ncbi:hypothetical protein Dimus_032814 [Dionaea muscipula]
MAVDELLPEEIRCNRRDGRDWRCKRPVMEGKKLCEIHYVQGRLRQYKEKVPDALKFKHGENRKPAEDVESMSAPASGGVAAECVGVRVSKRMSAAKRKQAKETTTDTTADEVLDGEEKLLSCSSVPEGGIKRRKTELIRMFVKREIERSNKPKKRRRKKMLQTKVKMKKKAVEVVRVVNKELTRDLPYGVMEISPEDPEPDPAIATETLGSGDNARPVGIKIGAQCFNSLGIRKFRSKNADRPPICTVKVAPFGASIGKGKTGSRGKCHWCRRSDNQGLVMCLSCKKEFFCEDCIKERYRDADEVKLACPVCRGICNCNSCRTSHSKDVGTKEILRKQCCKVTKHMCFRYLIRLLLPVIRKINQERDAQLQMVAKFEGKNLSEVVIRQADDGCQMQLSCNNCNSAIIDLHRSCLRCSYALCLGCCGYFGQGGWVASLETSVVKEQWRLKPCSSNKNLEKKQKNRYLESVGSIDIASSVSLLDSADCTGMMTCPPRESGGCAGSLLDLRSLFPYNWTKELERSAECVVSSQDDDRTFGDSLDCSLCANVAHEAAKDNELIEAARRKGSSDNFLYYPHAHGDHDTVLVHFQKHWRKGQPVIVQNIMLGDESNLTWDPTAMFCSYLERNSVESEIELEARKRPCCSDWYEVEFGIKDSFTWSLEDSHMHLQRETLKLKAELSSALSRRLFMDHYAEIANSLPLQEYTNPRSGLLNLAANLTRDFQGAELGQQIKILYGSREEVAQGNLVTSLHYHSHDLINILVHASDATCTIELCNNLRRLLRKKSRVKEEHAGNNLQSGEKLEHSEITDEAGEYRIVEETRLSSTTNREASTTTSPVKVHGSDTDSDASMICSGTTDSPEKYRNQTVDLDKSSKCSEKKTFSEPCSGSLWDIFRREDVPLLLEYIRRHSNELSGGCALHNEAAHPILDRRVFLDIDHKMKLKEEFRIEPWTFSQRVGEAVIIPAGCLYQTRSLKSCIHVTMGFISPENALECIKLMEQLHVLPEDHRARKSTLEVEKLAIHCVTNAIEEVSKLA